MGTVLLAIAKTGFAAHPTRVILSGGVGVPPAQEFNEQECEQEIYSSPLVMRD